MNSFEEYLKEATLPPHHDAFKRGFKSGVQGGGAAGNENASSVKAEHRDHYKAGVAAGKAHSKKHGVIKSSGFDSGGYKKPNPELNKHVNHHAPAAIAKHFGNK